MRKKEDKQNVPPKGKTKPKPAFLDKKRDEARAQPSSFVTKKRPAPLKPTAKKQELEEDMRLNKFIAHSGICARRKAAEHIENGEVSVNGEVVKEIGFRVKSSDKVTFQGKPVKPVEDKIYILMNKPKDTLTTVTDDRGRRTVMDIVGTAITERIFPVGRLDRDTTGLLLLTNDGALAEKLSHPSYRIKKVYHVILNKPLTKNDLECIRAGVELEDGIAEIDDIDYFTGKGKNELGVELHLGKNRIVRRIFEHLGYDVQKLDRVYYAGLTKKDLPRGMFRHLSEREIVMLKHFT